MNSVGVGSPGGRTGGRESDRSPFFSADCVINSAPPAAHFAGQTPRPWNWPSPFQGTSAKAGFEGTAAPGAKADVRQIGDVRFVPDSDMAIYSITSLARASNAGGTVRPSALAVLRLILSSIFVDCWTGIPDGFSPLRILPVYTPASRFASLTLLP